MERNGKSAFQQQPDEAHLASLFTNQFPPVAHLAATGALLRIRVNVADLDDAPGLAAS